VHNAIRCTDGLCQRILSTHSVDLNTWVMQRICIWRIVRLVLPSTAVDWFVCIVLSHLILVNHLWKSCTRERERERERSPNFYSLLWGRPVNTEHLAGVWLRATGNGDQCHPIGPWGSGRTLLFNHTVLYNCERSCCDCVRALYIQSDLRKDTEIWFNSLQKALSVSVTHCSLDFTATLRQCRRPVMYCSKLF